MATVNIGPPETSEETVKRALSTYEIGRKLRQLRLRKKIGLADLGKHTGLSASMLSQLETGKLIPTLPTLARIAMVFDVGVDYFFVDKRKRRLFSIVRKTERIRFPDRADSPEPQYFFECLAFNAPEKSVQTYMAEFPAGRFARPSEEHVHDGAEFVHVLEGTLQITYQDVAYTLEAGDSVYFDSLEPHSYRCASDVPARALVVSIPPEG